MPSGPVGSVDLVLSIAVYVMLGLKGGGGSTRGLILLRVLSFCLSVGSCASHEKEEYCAFSRLDCSLGERIVLMFVVTVSCVSCALL